MSVHMSMHRGHPMLCCSVHMSTYTRPHTLPHTLPHTCPHARAHTCPHTRPHTCSHKCLYTCPHTCPLSQVIDAVLFEPNLWQPPSDDYTAGCHGPPGLLPADKRDHLSTACGLLFNELKNFPSGISKALLDMVNLTLEMDTGAHTSMHTCVHERAHANACTSQVCMHARTSAPMHAYVRACACMHTRRQVHGAPRGSAAVCDAAAGSDRGLRDFHGQAPQLGPQRH